MSAFAIVTIDADYIRPRLAAIHLIIANGRAAFVDTGTFRSLPAMLEALRAQGLTASDVDYVLLTHVHLDHAGGAGALMRALPNAKCVVHPRGARHMIDPAKLSAAAQDVYGAQRFAAMYGELVPVDADRVAVVEDGQRLRLGDRELEFIHTPGHANHHYCIVDHDARVIFSGDTFGLSYRELDTAQGAFVMPITTPSQFDPEAAHRSIDRLVALRPQAIYVTHYSRIEGIEKLGGDLHESLDGYVAIASRHRTSEHRSQAMCDDLWAFIDSRLDRHGVRKDKSFRRELLNGDIRLNVQGLEVWLQQQDS